jgi:dTDP-4-dehydro-6-deoxy-alpha-D-glucopyranose 2,3-dehydratase
MNKIRKTDIDFFESALAKDSDVISISHILEWIKMIKKEVNSRVEQIPIEKMRLWKFDDITGNIVHESGRFFSIEGIRVETNWGNVLRWEQPIINQPEIGLLGLITKKINGILHFLVQAKIEPGNLNVVQISPTLQATKSNYTRVHKGKIPAFLEYFNGDKSVKILLDQLQSEQGARFLRKRNRNIIVEISEKEDLHIPNNFIWVTLGQLKELIKYDNMINMDTRTVISGISFGSYGTDTLEYFSALSNLKLHNKNLMHSMLNNEIFLNDFDRIISWITNLKSRFDLNVIHIPLRSVNDWKYDGLSINHKDKKYFSVIGVKVEIGNREVISWDQPMVRSIQEGILAFIVKPFNGVYHFLVQAKLEAGNLDILELAPTVQCLTGNYRIGQNEFSVPFLDDVLNAKEDQIWYSALQSEEGGRFYKENNRNMIIEARSDFPTEVPDNYCWMTLNQLSTFIKFNNYLNIAARSLISAVSF